MITKLIIFRLEDAIDAFTMIFNGSNNGWLLGWTMASSVAVAFNAYASEDYRL